MKPMQPCRMWAWINPSGYVCEVRRTRQEAIAAAELSIGDPWPTCRRKHKQRVLPVTIEAE